MTHIDEMRDFITSLYPGPKWKKKVKKMSDAQVTAIYMREQNNPKAKKKRKRNKESGNDDIPF